MLSRIRLAPPQIIALVLLTLALAAPVAARDVVPAPAGGGEGLAVLPEDNLPPFGEGPFAPRDDETAVRLDREAGTRADDIGGDDVIVQEYATVRHPTMDIAANGDIYIASTVYPEGETSYIEVHISSDGGMTFELWGTLTDPGTTHYRDPDLRVVEGTVSGCYLVYRTGSDIRMVSSPLGGAAASFGAEVPSWTKRTSSSIARGSTPM